MFLYICLCFTLQYILMKKLKFNYFLIIKTKNNALTLNTFCNLQNYPTFHIEDRLVNIFRRRECIVGPSILLVFGSVAPSDEKCILYGKQIDV